MEYGFIDGWERMGRSLKRIITGGFVGDNKTGYDMNKPGDKAIKDNLEKVQDKTWGDTFKDILGVDFTGAPMLIIAVIMLVYLALKD